MLLYIDEEIPFYKDDREKREKIQDNLPQNLPRGGTKEYKSLQEFCPKVEIILQTVNENEFYAATTFLKPPNDLFKKAVIFPENCIVLGKFGNKRVALIQTKVGDNAGNFIKKAHEIFSSAPYYIGIGVCYAFDDEKYKLGDVIVSEKICTLTNSAIGEIVEDRGQRIDVHEDLQSIFCRDRVLRPVDEFKVCEGRPSEIHCGPIISCPFLIKDAIFRDRILAATDNAIAGEMEGGQLLKFVNQGKVKGIIVIKGVVDYGDERKKKDWQFVTAMAALQYAECKLRNQPPLIPEGNIAML